jgi:hypothetical protein
MKKGIFGLAGVCAGIALICFCGDSGNNATIEPATTVPIASLRLDSTAVPGWTDSGYISGDRNNVFVSIDGEAEVYKTIGMQYYAQQTMLKAEHSVTLLVLDFATVQNAKNMYNRKKEFGVAWGTYSPDKVVLDCQEFVTTVYAQINKYFFQLQFSVDGDSTGAVASAGAFYNKYLSLLQ